MARSAHPKSTLYNEHFECALESTEVLVDKNVENSVACVLPYHHVMSKFPTTRIEGERLTVP